MLLLPIIFNISNTIKYYKYFFPTIIFFYFVFLL